MGIVLGNKSRLEEGIQIPTGISTVGNPSIYITFPPRGRFSLQPSAASSKLVAAPKHRTGFQEEPVNQPSAGAPMESLQFDHAERDGSAASLTCAVCSQAIATSYYEVNGNVTCQRCRSQTLAGWNRGSPGGRFAKALGLGLGAAVVGAGIYFGIAALTGYEFGLVAIVVGVLVGGAVRKGSNGRGGRRYQLLAMFLTYTAVVVTDSSLIARELKKEWRAQAAAPAAVTDGINVSTGAAVGTAPRPGPLAIALGLALIISLAYAAPIMIGITSPLHLLIAGFALYEAWKLNRGVALQITGPYQAAARPAAA